MTTTPPPVRRVYLATATGALHASRRVVRPRAVPVCVTCRLAIRYPAPLSISPQQAQPCPMALDLADALGYFLGIDLVGIILLLRTI